LASTRVSLERYHSGIGFLYLRVGFAVESALTYVGSKPLSGRVRHTAIFPFAKISQHSLRYGSGNVCCHSWRDRHLSEYQLILNSNLSMVCGLSAHSLHSGGLSVNHQISFSHIEHFNNCISLPLRPNVRVHLRRGRRLHLLLGGVYGILNDALKTLHRDFKTDVHRDFAWDKSADFHCRIKCD